MFAYIYQDKSITHNDDYHVTLRYLYITWPGSPDRDAVVGFPQIEKLYGRYTLANSYLNGI